MRRPRTWPTALSSRRAASSRGVLKAGRTHLQDAVPITLGQEFGGYAAYVARGAGDVDGAADAAARAEPRRNGCRHRPERRRRLHAALPSRNLARATPGCRCARRRTASASRRAWATCSPSPGALRRLAVEVSKVASATCACSAWARAPGIAEITLPPVQPGSSIMPGKVNPSMPEMVNQVCFQVSAATPRSSPRRGGPTGAERDDAGHGLERAARDAHPDQRDARAAGAVCQRRRRRR